MTVETWRRTRLKFVADVNSHVLDENTDPAYRFTYVDIGNVTQGNIDLPTESLSFGTAPSRARRIAKAGDSVVSTVRTYLRAVATVPASEEPLIFSTGFAVLSPTAAVSSRFLGWYLQADEFVSRVEANSTGVSYPAITATDLASLDLWIPDLSYQELVADYLERETSNIDSLIHEQTVLIDLVREQRRARLRALVRGEGEVGSVRKGTTAPWLDDLPEHWGASPIKWLSPVRRGASPRPIEDPAYFDAEGRWSWVRIGDVTAASNGRLATTSQRLSTLGASKSVKLNPGSLFLSIAASVGKPCITEIECCIHDGFVYFPDLQIDPRWLYLIFEVGDCFAGLGKFGTQLNLNTDTIGTIVVPVPPTGEIHAAVSEAQLIRANSDRLIAESERLVELSMERRAALITAVVTGQIDVREVA